MRYRLNVTSLFFWGETMKIEMRETKHLWITYNPADLKDRREIIIDEEKKDVRICDGSSIIKVRFENGKIKDILVNDVFVYP